MTCLHSRDAGQIGLPMDLLWNQISVDGIDGNILYYLEPAVLYFDDNSIVRSYPFDLLIANPQGGSMETPSLLGRNIINEWYVQYDPTKGLLHCTVRNTGIGGVGM